MLRVVLDSSPIRESVPANRPQRHLKRTASTASLPTPPQTVENKRRYTRSHSRGSGHESNYESDSRKARDQGPPPARRLNFGIKKQRTDRLDAVLASLSGEDSENPFWDGPVELQEEHLSPVTSPMEHFRGKAPVSPPPSSRRQNIICPSAPRKKNVAIVDQPIRDTPNNPFLDDSPMSISGEPVEPQTPTEHVEKPTVTYVLYVLYLSIIKHVLTLAFYSRGVKATFDNPLYSLPPEVHERSLLPIDHPDYSPNPACAPKLLFPEARLRKPPSSPSRRSAGRPSSSAPSHHADDEWEDSDEEPLCLTPPKMLFREP